MDASHENSGTSSDSSDSRKRLFGSSWQENLVALSELAVKIFAANCLFIIFSLPVFTIPASKISLTKVMLKIYQQKPCPVWRVFWGEFKKEFFLKTVIGIVLMFTPLSAVLYIYFSSGNVFTIAVFAIYLAAAYLIECYWMTAVSFVDVPVWPNFRNAVLLTFSCLKRSFTLLVTAGLANALLILFLPYTLILFLFCFALIQLIICTISLYPVKEHLIRDQRA